MCFRNELIAAQKKQQSETLFGIFTVFDFNGVK